MTGRRRALRVAPTCVANRWSVADSGTADHTSAVTVPDRGHCTATVAASPYKKLSRSYGGARAREGVVFRAAPFDSRAASFPLASVRPSLRSGRVSLTGHYVPRSYERRRCATLTPPAAPSPSAEAWRSRTSGSGRNAVRSVRYTAYRSSSRGSEPPLSRNWPYPRYRDGAVKPFRVAARRFMGLATF